MTRAFCSGELILEILLSPEDMHLLDDHKWTLTRGRLQRMVKVAPGVQKALPIYRQIMGDPVGLEVDHINGNHLDNRRENLRVCTKAENSRNKGVRAHNKLGVKGVYLDARRGKYRAQIRVDGRKHDLGCFDSIDAAKARYNQAALEFHGQFAKF